MGGDDLGSDDEYLKPASAVDASDSVSLDNFQVVEDPPLSSKKRKRTRKEDLDDFEAVEEVPTKKSSARVLVEAGRDLENKSADVQAAFLWKVLTHNLQMKGESIANIPKLVPSRICTSAEATMPERLKDAVSMKKLKKWKNIGSPMVMIVCLSARRAVAVLKEMAAFNVRVRAAKLFAKHMDASEQRSLLRQHAYGLAVGTPHRLQALCSEEPGKNQAALSFQHTQLFILDSHTNPKGYTVCTLPDTAPSLMQLLGHQILPHMKKRKDLKIAMF